MTDKLRDRIGGGRGKRNSTHIKEVNTLILPVVVCGGLRPIPVNGLWVPSEETSP